MRLSISIVVIVVLCIAEIVGVFVDPEHSSIDSSTPPSHRTFCVDLSRDSSVCASNPLMVRERVDNRLYTLGVEQRIDGSEAEKAAVTQILMVQTNYFHEEVWSRNAYAEVRDKCVNKNDLCAFWATLGECNSNRIFMVPNCPAACRFCLVAHWSNLL